MITRALETKKVIRTRMKQAVLRKKGKAFAEFGITGAIAKPKYVSSADPEMENLAKRVFQGETASGCVRIDVLSPTAFRVRYAQADAVPENKTPMVERWTASPCKITEKDGIVVMSTAKMKIKVTLDPFRIETVVKGKTVCGIGGPEKDYFNVNDSYNTGVAWTPDGKSIATENFDLRPQEAIYGFGEHFIKLNKVGQTIDLTTADALGVLTPRMYKAVPFYVSTSGYGVYFNHSSLMTYWVGSLSAADIQAAAEDDFLDYVVFTGNIPKVLSQYTALTGKGVVPPEWTFGYWQSKISYTSAEETLDIARKLRQHDIPCSVIHLDTHWFKADWYCDLEFDKTRFPDPKAYMAELRKMGIRVSLWQLPYIPEGSALFEAFKAVGGFVKDKDGGIYNVKICFTKGFQGVVGCIDFTNPAAVTVYQTALRRLFKMGAAVIKTDFGEAAPLDGVYHDGTPGHRMHNLYPLLYNKAAFEVTKAVHGAGVVWARSAWAGSQRYPLHWGGDNSPNWANIVPQMEGGLSLGLSGFQFWSQDIGGFLSQTGGDLLIRWMQMSMFISHSRIHGVGVRELYAIPGKDVQRICRDYIKLRYRMMPYIMREAKKCVAKSLPMARALVVEFQDDPNTWNIGDQWLFGDDILVAPIMDETGTRRVYLPEGTWTDWWTRKKYKGGTWLTVKAAIDKIPLYLRNGAVIACGHEPM